MSSHCVITGLKTKNKFQNIFIHEDIIDLARDILKEKPEMSMKEAIRQLQNQLTKDLGERHAKSKADDALKYT